MNKISIAITASILLNFAIHCEASSQIKERSDIPAKYKWDLTHLYESDESWEEERSRIDETIETLSRYKGILMESASDLLACLEFRDKIGKKLRRLSSYSWNKARQDQRNSKFRAMDQETNLLTAKFQTYASYIEPEILASDEETIKRFIASEPGLRPYKFYINDLLRRKKHTFSESLEKLIGEAGRMTGSPASIYNSLANTELVNTEVNLSNGKILELNQQSFGRERTQFGKEDRDLIYRAFYKELNKYRSAFGALMNAKVNADLFITRARGFDDCLQMNLYPNNIPVAVFHNLIAGAGKHLDKFHRYLNIRKRLLSKDKLDLTDLSLPISEGRDLNYPVEKAKKIILESLRPLGRKSTSIVKKAFESPWIDYFPTPGKRSRNYTDLGAYAEHPYIFLNYTGGYDSMSAFIHELGHFLHRYLADREQPFSTSGYSSFIAEVAALFNEALLKARMLEEIKDDDLRLSILLSSMRERAIFDQAQVSEFELKIHQEVEKGKTLTGDTISQIYLETLKKYYGHDQGICTAPEFMDIDWIYERLLFINTYRIYVYATAQIATTALVEKVLAGENGAVEKYLSFLSAGGSDYPINLLKKAGVDMTTSEPFEKTMDSMVRAMDEIERLLEKKGY